MPEPEPVQEQQVDTPVPATDSTSTSEFCLADSKLNKGFCYNFNSCLLKRFNNYRRSYKQLFIELFIPSAFMIFGVKLAHTEFEFRSPSIVYDPSAYPAPQKILINSEMINPSASNLNTTDIVSNFEPLGDFDIFYSNETVDPLETNFTHFSQKVFDFGRTECAE